MHNLHNLHNHVNGILFTTVETADEADLNKAITKSYDASCTSGLDDLIKKLCKALLNLLASATKGDPKLKQFTSTSETVEPPALRSTLVMKCCTFYNGLLNIKFAGGSFGNALCNVLHALYPMQSCVCVVCVNLIPSPGTEGRCMYNSITD